MRRTPPLRIAVLTTVLAAAGFAVVAKPAMAVEMFTYFGDGSQIGLPSLEVPIEAYPGIPLRSDRLRARRAGKRPPRGTIGHFQGRGITIRVPAEYPMPVEEVSPETQVPEPTPVAEPTPAETSSGTSVTRDAHEPGQPITLSETADEDLGSRLDFGGLREFSAFEQSR